LSAKTESQKFRVEIEPDVAHGLQSGAAPLRQFASLLPADLQARLLQLVEDEPLLPVVSIGCRRYAVENASDRYTLDVDVHTHLGKRLPHGILEFKSTQADPPPGSLQALGLRPIKLSKFLWATGV